MTQYRKRRKQAMSPPNIKSLAYSTLILSTCNAFTTIHLPIKRTNRPHPPTSLSIHAPPGSGYLGRNPYNPDPSDPYLSQLTPEQIKQICPPPLPDTYEPMLEYPGTMRPGKTPENMPYHDLPGLGLDDPDPVPWPHFQEIEWHHAWDPPHDQFPLMEDYIEMQGRWASVEEEAEMRVGMRRGVRERREMEESSSNDGVVIMDDDEEDSVVLDVPSVMGLGDGVEGLIGKGKVEEKKKKLKKVDVEEEEEDDGDDDFLFDLGLGDADDEEEEEGIKAKPKKGKAKVKASLEEESSDDDDDDLDFDLGFDLDDDDDIDIDEDDDDTNEDDSDDMFDDFDDDDNDVSIDDLNAKDDGGDDDDFDDGGFDYDD